MFRYIFGVILYICIFTCGWAKEITILHTNDIHCAVDEGVELSGVAWLKQVYKKADLPVVLVDAGDAVQGAPLGALTKGAAIIRLMNAAQYDFAIPGNHEFDYGMDNFQILADGLDCHYYSANILEQGKLMFEPYKIFTFDGVQVAFVGVTTPSSLVSASPLTFRDPLNPKKQIYSFGEDNRQGKASLYRYIQKAVDRARKKGAKYVILVAHLGNHVRDWGIRQALQHLRGVDAVIDGHSHENYEELMEDAAGKKVLVTQTGTRLECVGRITIGEDGKFTADKVKFVGGKDPLVAEGIQVEKQDYEGLLMKTLGNTAYGLWISDPVTHQRLVRRQETNLGDFVADAYRWVLKSDIALVGGGGVRADVGTGTITYRDALSVNPFGNRLCVAHLTGREILDVLEFSLSHYPEEFGGFLQVSGLTFEADISIPSSVKLKNGSFEGIKGLRRVKNVQINGEALQPEKVYTVGGPDFIMIAGGDGYSMLTHNVKHKRLQLLDIDALQEYLHTYLEGVVPKKYSNPAGEGRIKICK